MVCAKTNLANNDFRPQCQRIDFNKMSYPEDFLFKCILTGRETAIHIELLSKPHKLHRYYNANFFLLHLVHCFLSFL